MTTWPNSDKPKQLKEKRGSRAAHGVFASVKMKSGIPFRIQLQRDYLYIIDRVPTITYIGLPKSSLAYEYKDETRHFTASYQLIESGKDVTVLVDYAKKLIKPRMQFIITEAQQLYEGQGNEWRVVTDAWIYSGYRLRNARTLTQYALHNVDPTAKQLVIDCLETRGGSLSLDELLSVFSSVNPAFVTIVAMQMVFFNEIVCPLDDKPLSRASILSLPETVR